MGVVDKEKLENMMNTTGGTINNEVVEYAKSFLIERLTTFVSNENELQEIKNKLQKLKIEFVSDEEFKKNYEENNGKGFLPGAFVTNDVLYFKNYSSSFHNLIHEFLHIISKNGDKHGLYQILRDKKQYYGYGFNEAFTEHLTSIVLDESFSGYSYDLNYMIQLFMICVDLKVEDLFSLYISKEEWISDELVQRFNSTNEDLITLLIEYDQRLSQTRNRKFNPDKALMSILNSLKLKIDNNVALDTIKISKLLKDYYNYFEEFEKSQETKEKISEILDGLGTYQHSHSK